MLSLSLFGIVPFVKFAWTLGRTFYDTSDPNDVAVSLALYVVYPSILWLLLDKFHGVCGPAKWQEKIESIYACKSLFLWFTVFLRSYKLGIVMLHTFDANEKEGGSQTDLQYDNDDDNNNNNKKQGGGLRGMLFCCGGKQKCQIWMHLIQECLMVGFVAFLLLLCLPVLAFWFMFLSILISIYNMVSLLKRIWNEAQHHYNQEGRRIRGGSDEDDVEFQEFLNNFTNESDDDTTNNGEE